MHWGNTSIYYRKKPPNASYKYEWKNGNQSAHNVTEISTAIELV